MTVRIIQGDCRATLKTLADASINCCVTSPPYWGLRDYGNAAQIGKEKTPDAYVAELVAVFREVRRVLREDGTCWINLGDSYCSTDKWGGGSLENTGKQTIAAGGVVPSWEATRRRKEPIAGIKPKDLVGIPWLVAFALRADGWWLRQDIIWAKANCMPESVRDRPTRSHEYIFLLAKAANYYYDADAIKEPCIYDVDGTGTAARKARQHDANKSNPTSERAGIRAGGYKNSGNEKQRGHSRRHDGLNDRWDAMEKAEQCTGMRNKRDVWTVAPANYPEAHFATFPPALIRPCILAGCPVGGTVLDPFGGSGTTGEVAEMEGRNSILCELNADYVKLAEKRTEQRGLFCG